MQSSAAVMRNHSAKVMSGTKLAKGITSQLSKVVASLKQKNITPGLTVIQVGGRKDSTTYIKMKAKAATSIGMNFNHHHLEENVSEEQLLSDIRKLNEDPNVHGLLVQMPLPKHISQSKVCDAILPRKDVDGFNSTTVGQLMKGEHTEGHISCTPAGCIELLKDSGIKVEGKTAVVLGRSNIVGRPIASLLEKLNASVTICHSRTKDLPSVVKGADIVVAAIGKANFVKGEWLKPNAVVIDVGINHIEDSKGKSKLVGDVDFESASETAGMITPVPGGVGPMTVAMLIKNTVLSAQQFAKDSLNTEWNFTPLPLHCEKVVPSDIDIATKAVPKPIFDLAKEMHIKGSEIDLYGKFKAKLSLSIIDRLKQNENGSYVVVAGITPTPLGEGKSTTAIGLVQAMGAHQNVNSIACVRQPSQGPTFGIKGGAAGGGYSQVIPMEDFNLHLTGDIHAISAANNLVAAAIDTRMFHESTTPNNLTLFKRLVPKGEYSTIQKRRLKKLGFPSNSVSELTDEQKGKFARLDLDPESISWRRVVDVNDRFLRNITVGEGSAEKGHTRKTGYDISVASEIMAVLALSNDMHDMKNRFSKMVVGNNKQGEPITVDDLGLTGAITVLMKDSIRPTLMQTLEGTPVLIHAGPFANIAHGNSSIIADRIGLKLVGKDGFVVTEAGFGSDIGFEKFCNIKARSSGLTPNCVVLVATIRALKMHGGAPKVTAGKPLDNVYKEENLEFLEKGCANLARHINVANSFNVPVVVAINQFASDTVNEIELLQKKAKEAGAFDAVVSNNHALGGKGSVELAEAVSKACKQENKFEFLYDVNDSIESKMETIVKKIYGGDGIEISEEAQKKIDILTKQGFANLPICMAKTHLSFSADGSAKGAPKGFTIPIRDVRCSAGAGFIYPLCGEMSTMPGLPTRPCFYDIDYDPETDNIVGLS